MLYIIRVVQTSSYGAGFDCVCEISSASQLLEQTHVHICWFPWPTSFGECGVEGKMRLGHTHTHTHTKIDGVMYKQRVVCGKTPVCSDTCAHLARRVCVKTPVC